MTTTAAPAASRSHAGPALIDVAVIGGGIVGLATAHQLSTRYPDKKIVILEKEQTLAHHQTGHNSGVLHSGIYYKPGSMKAINCRRGKAMMEAFCDENAIDYEVCGKVIVAREPKDLGPMRTILDRGKANGVACEQIGVERLHELEPHAVGVAGIHVPETGIVNYKQVCEKLADSIRERGGEVRTDSGVQDIHPHADSLQIETARGTVEARYLINCSGLHSDRLTKLSGQEPPVKIIPFRGEYFELKPSARSLVKNLIYPTPDPAFPFLGVHFTRMITSDAGGHHVECGPNAVLAWKREGYTRTALHLGDLAETLMYPAFWKMAKEHWRSGAAEMWRSFSKKAFVKALQRLVPEIRSDDLEEAPAGVRAQALSPDGKLLDDFAVAEGERVVNVLNAPSPAATASLAIGDYVVDLLAKRF